MPNNPTRRTDPFTSIAHESMWRRDGPAARPVPEYEAIGVAPEVLAAWLHHRFTQIHPFQDGTAGWPGFSPASSSSARSGCRCRGAGRPGELHSGPGAGRRRRPDALISLFASLLTRSFIRALSDVHVVEQQAGEHLDDVLAAIRDQVIAGRPNAGTLDDLRVAATPYRLQRSEEYADASRPVCARPFPTCRRGPSQRRETANRTGARIELAKHDKFFADFTVAPAGAGC